MSPSQSVEVSDTAPSGETKIRRASQQVNGLIERPVDGVDTVTDVLNYAARVHGTKNAVGWREIIDVHEEEKEIKKNVGGKEVVEKKKWKYFQLGDYQYISFVQVKEAAQEIALGLVDLGIEKGQVFNIYAQTSVNWQLVQHACCSIGTVIATAYDTLGESGLQHALNEPDCAGVFTNSDLLPTLLNVVPNTPSIRYIIYDGKASQAHLDKIKAVRDGAITVLHLDELRARGKGKDEAPLRDRAPKRPDLACIMYTSGSTGAPKGVLLTHANLISAVGSIRNHTIGQNLKSSDYFLAFLPLSHVLEYIVELALFFIGVTTGYGRVKTLTDASVRNCLGDIRAFRPTIMVGVPAVWELIRKGIVGKVNSSGGLKKSVFNGALDLKKLGIPGVTQLIDAAILSQVRAQTGGRLRLTLSGGAALSKETQEFLTLALVTVLQGYGLTESCGMCAILSPEHFEYGTAGAPVGSIEIKLLDVPDAGYFATNKTPQGEILIRGPSVTSGYFKRDDLNQDESIFTKDGWFRTGDVGQWNANGTLSIIDRIKNLVKLQGGEYIALERLESTYKSCNLVSNICVHADTNAKQPIAIVIPHVPNLRHYLASTGNKSINSEAEIHELCEKPEVAALVLKECNAAGKKAGFKPMEMLQAVILTPDEWTPESGLVTAAQKIQRKKIAETFSKEIKAAYKNQD
ncbi:acetyl-CoA synthetase-like protein [Sistotremastrum niveocremeum HHB9708]|uniref:Acetyl-CoA synthetase-like protein n=1 Tax=Sistotremastrum niveocremeum HHB9708 TaxID=1314777 RepID=A0A164PHZ2_9AGAM|nr:acetyl-CoA synthetase-like protein [Sistotremastrum niveocremeum HHB9708]